MITPTSNCKVFEMQDYSLGWLTKGKLNTNIFKNIQVIHSQINMFITVATEKLC